MRIRTSVCASLAQTRHFHTSRQRWNSENAPLKDPSYGGREDSAKEIHNDTIDAEDKTIATVVGPLPLSPLMDPSFHAARRRFTQPKKPPPPIHEKLEWQRELERNPYAHALATPVRRCHVTQAFLPRFFLQDFGLLAHPETGAPWWVPHSLEAAQPVRDPGAESLQSAKDGTGDKGPSASRRPKNTKSPGPRGYVLCRQSLLQQFRATKSRYSGAQRRISRQTGSGQYSNLLNRAVWRDDMDLLLLELMRRRIVERLLYYSSLTKSHQRKHIIKCTTWDDTKEHSDRGCLLWLGRNATVEQNENESSSPTTVDEPAQLTTLAIDGRLAVHNLKLLLGDDHVQKLREGSETLRSGELFLLGRQRTIDLQLKLWKLQGYILATASKQSSV